MAEISSTTARIALCSALAWLLGGGASPVPLAPPVLEAKVLSLQTLVQSPAFARDHWWQDLHDLALNKLLAQALAAHPRLTLASALEAAACARQAIAASTHGPFVSANASWNRQRYSSDALVPPPIAGSWQNLSQLGLSLDYSFDVWGKVRERVTAAAGAQAAAHLQQDSARLWLQSEVVSQFVQWRAAQQELALAQEALGLSESLAALLAQGVSMTQALGLVNQQITQCSYFMSATDIFYLFAVLFLLLIALVWLARSSFSEKPADAGEPG